MRGHGQRRDERGLGLAGVSPTQEQLRAAFAELQGSAPALQALTFEQAMQDAAQAICVRNLARLRARW